MFYLMVVLNSYKEGAVMSNTFTAKDTWGILKLSQMDHHFLEPTSTSNKDNYPKQNRDRVFEKALFVTHADIFNVYRPNFMILP